MKFKMSRAGVMAALVAVGFGGMMAYQAMAMAMRAGQPTVVVTVNLSQVLEKLDHRADAEARLNEMRVALENEQQRRQNELKDLDARGQALDKELAAADAARRLAIEKQMQEIQEQGALAALQYQAWLNYNSDKVDIEAALIMQDLYRQVKAAAAQMASTNRYDIVLVDDSQGELSTSGDSRVSRRDQVRQQIAMRRLLYVNPAIDITDDLIARMNNARRTAGPRPQ